MRVRLQYILVILLFALTGPLCRQQGPDAAVGTRAAHSVRAMRPECRAFECTVLAADAEGGRQAFTLLAAAEFIDGALAPTLDQKAFARSVSLLGYSASKYPAASAAAVSYLAPPPPGGVKYYIYTLGKIRI